MARLLHRERNEDNTGKVLPSVSLVVQGVPYSNAAAKFWVTLLDEIRADYPTCSLVELTASDAGELKPEQLFPEIELEREIERLSHANIALELQRTMAQLELLGPPAAVEITLRAEGREILRQMLPDECVDAEIFPYLLVWLLEWAGLPSPRWNDALVRGEIDAIERAEQRRYRFALELQSRHLAEGLYQRTLRLWPKHEEEGSGPGNQKIPNYEQGCPEV